MRVKITAENVLVGSKNYRAGDVVEFVDNETPAKNLVAAGKAEATDMVGGESISSAVLPRVEDKATLHHPIAGAVVGVADEFVVIDQLCPVTAQSEVKPDGTPAPVNAQSTVMADGAVVKADSKGKKS